jgi:hypothetical protein
MTGMLAFPGRAVNHGTMTGDFSLKVSNTLE